MLLLLITLIKLGSGLTLWLGFVEESSSEIGKGDDIAGGASVILSLRTEKCLILETTEKIITWWLYYITW